MDQGTKTMVEGKEGSLEDLKAGEEVRASFQEKYGKNVATTLDVSESGQGSMGTQSRMGSRGTMGSQGGSTSGGQKQ